MALASNGGGILIDPNGSNATIDITTLAGSRAAVFADPACTTPLTIPRAIAVTTAFYVKTQQVCNISIMVNSVECGTPAGVPLVYNFLPGAVQGFSLPFNATVAEQFIAVGGAVPTSAAGVSSFNTRVGAVVLGKSDITGTNLNAADVGAVARTGGGPEGLVVENATGAYTFDLSRGSYFALTVTGDVTFTMPTVVDGSALSFVLHVFNPNNHVISWGSTPTITWLAKQVPTLTPSSDDILSFLCEGDHTNFFGLHVTAKLAIGATYLDITASAEPANPPSGVIRLWFDLTQQIFLYKDFAGNKHQLGASAPGGGTITQVSGQLVTGTNASATSSYALTLPATPTNGNMLVAVFGTENTGTITPPSGWTVDKEYGGTHALGKIGVYRHTSTGIAGDATATFTFTGTHFCYMSFAEYTGQAASPVDQTAQNEAAAATHVDITTSATGQASELAIAGFRAGAYGGGGAIGWGSSGFATIYDTGFGASGSKPLSATGAVTASPTVNATVDMMGVVVTYKAA